MSNGRVDQLVDEFRKKYPKASSLRIARLAYDERRKMFGYCGWAGCQEKVQPYCPKHLEKRKGYALISRERKKAKQS